MAAFVHTNTLVVVGSTDISGQTVQIETSPSECGTVDITTLQSGGFMCLAAALKGYGLTIDGLADHTATTGITNVFPPSALGTQYAVSACPQTGGATAGDIAIFTRGILNEYTPWGGAIGEAAKLKMGFTADTAEVNGRVAAPLATRGALTGTSLQLGAVSATQKMWAALHVTGGTFTNLAVTIQSDNATGFPSQATQITFSTVASGTGWQFSSVAGAITDDWWRVVSTIGSGTATYLVVFGIL